MGKGGRRKRAWVAVIQVCRERSELVDGFVLIVGLRMSSEKVNEKRECSEPPSFKQEEKNERRKVLLYSIDSIAL